MPKGFVELWRGLGKLVNKIGMNTYIEEKSKEFAMNIDEYQIHQIVNFCGCECQIVDKTSNSIMLFIWYRLLSVV